MLARLLIGAAFVVGGLGYAAPAQATPSVTPCHAYLFTGTNQNLCDDMRDVTGDLDCPDVQFQVTLVDKAYDPWGLDNDHDGKGCDSNELFPVANPQPGPTKTKPTTSKSPTHKPTHKKTSTSPSQRHTEAATAGGPTLPKTGPSAYALVGLGTLAVAGGAGLIIATRRRRNTFEA